MRPERERVEAAPEAERAVLQTVPTRRLAILATVSMLLGFGILYFYSDGMKLLEAAAGISWPRFLVPVGATLLSYVLMALSYEGIAAAAGNPIGLRSMLRITYVSNTVNYLIATGGLSGFAVRMYFFRQNGIPMGRAVTVSFVQGLLTNLALLVFLVMGFYFLATHEALGPMALALAGGLLALFLLVMALCVVLLLRPRLRRRVLFQGGEVFFRVARRFGPAGRCPRRTRIWRLQHNIDRGFGFMLANWRQMLMPTVYILLDWVATLAVLWGCFWSVNLLVPPPLITVGFSVAILSSIVSLAPGGLGIMESLTSGLFAALGTPLAPTVIALILFRLSYYALPFVVSVVFFRGMLHDAREHSHPP